MKKEIRLTVGKLLFIVLIMLGLNIISSSAATSYAINANNIGYADNSSIGADNVQAAIDGTCTKFSNQLTNLKKDVINEMYPKGSIYITTELTTKKAVEEKFSGTWESYGAGKTLVGIDTNDTSFNTVGKTSGSKLNSTTLTVANLPSHSHEYSKSNSTTESHTLTVNEIPSHSHTTGISGTQSFDPSTAIHGGGKTAVVSFAQTLGVNTAATGGGRGHTHDIKFVSSSTTKVGSGTAFTTSTLQPYIVVYMWRRIA